MAIADHAATGMRARKQQRNRAQRRAGGHLRLITTLPASDARRTLVPMDRIGPYDLLELLGRGGIGRVYRAVHRDSGDEVAVKLLHGSHRDGSLARRLLVNEAIAAGRLRHPNIVELRDGGLDESGSPFLVTELVRGPELASFITRWPGLPAIAHVLDGLLAGLVEAHAFGVVHRDLKPENVLVDARDPDRPLAKIADFGLARLLDPTAVGPVPDGAGTRAYMAPEQLVTGAPNGPWTDLHAVGAIVFELLSGTPIGSRMPFRARPGLVVPRALVRLLEALLDPEPHRRPRFASAVRSDLAALLARARDRGVSTIAREPTRVGRETVPFRADGESAPSAIRPAVTSLPVWRLRDPPLVGRERECAQLDGLVGEVARSRVSRVLLIEGPAGIGKSRIARAGIASVERSGAMESLTTGYDDGDDTAGGLRREIARLVGVPAIEPSGRLPASWGFLAELDPALDFSTLARWLRGGTTDPPVERLASTIHALLVALSRVRPIYLWLDDVGWARDGAWELLERIAARPHEGAILVVATAKAPLEDLGDRARRVRALARRRSVERIALEPLAPSDAEELARQTSRSLDRDLAAIALTSGGSPLAVVELASTASPAGSFVARRIDELLACAPGERVLRVLGVAAILGGRFEDRVLRAAAPAPVVDLVLDLALFGGLLRVDRENAYRFEHAVYRDELLQRVARLPDQNALYLSAARALVGTYGDERADVSARSAVLLRRGGEPHEAWQWLLHASTMNARAGDASAAASHLALAARWLRADRVPKIDERRARVLLARASALYFASSYERAKSIAQEAAAMAERLGLDDLVADCRALEANVCFYMGAHDESRRLADACARHAALDERGHAVLGFIVHHRLAELAQVRGDLDSGKRHLEESRRFAAASQTSWRLGISDINLAEIELARGEVALAKVRTDDLQRTAAAIGDETLLGEITDVAARVELFSGNAMRARLLLEPRARQLETLGDAWRLASLRLLEALASAELDPPARVGRSVSALVRAFDKTPIDDAFSSVAIERLLERLEARALAAAARRVRKLAVDRARWRGQPS
jgi:serine/threonine protein kinase